MPDTDREQHLATRMAALARAVAAPRSIEKVLSAVIDTAHDVIPNVDAAGVLLTRKGGSFTTLPHGGLTDRLHRLQMRFGEGPCVQAALADVVVRTDDFRAEKRWPRYAPACVELGIFSSLSFKLYTADRTAGALDLFSSKPAAWTGQDGTFGAILAAHAASAILASQHGQSLEAALSTRDRIGQAKGIIMERFKIDDIWAFEMLCQLSQESNTKLIEVAQRVIDTR
jgi:hypothetical protein